MTLVIFDVTNGSTGPAGPQGVEGLVWRSAYNANTAYSIDDAISYNGSAYICTQAGTGKNKGKRVNKCVKEENLDESSDEVMVAKMLAKALGDDNKWSEMSAPELYAELESTNPEVADMLHKVALTIYDVKLKERAYKDVGVADTVKDQRGKEFNFDKGSKKFKSQDGEEADITTKLGKDLMRQRKNHMKRTSPSYPNKHSK